MKKKIEKVLSFLPAEIEIIRTIDSLKNNSCGKKKTKERVSEFAFITTVPGEPVINRMKKKI
ncbi:hypothetical protein ACXO2Z_01665 [Lactobacillus delbrueckii subsp. bulgaricus]|nr:hypothetical protein [Lactobacillus delbrueckii subsp. bulgaricus]MBT8921695.1 hypothetical protein [Lactobacillus delbrueckii subsp. bulgaricus]MBT8928248.1 hypothetical protein [Lactobacillus delbrueckii subsp. bulgaricus]